MDADPTSLVVRLVRACLAVLVAAMALQGAVWILQEIWLWVIGAAVIAVISVAVYDRRTRL